MLDLPFDDGRFGKIGRNRPVRPAILKAVQQLCQIDAVKTSRQYRRIDHVRLIGLQRSIRNAFEWYKNNACFPRQAVSLLRPFIAFAHGQNGDARTLSCVHVHIKPVQYMIVNAIYPKLHFMRGL